MSLVRSRTRLSIAVTIAFALLAVPTSSALGAGIAHVSIDLGSNCIYLWNAGSLKTVKVEWRSWDGALKAKWSKTSSATGEWKACDGAEEVETFDIVTVKQGVLAPHVFQVPPLVGFADRVTDTLEGYSVPNSVVSISLTRGKGRTPVGAMYGTSSDTDENGYYIHGFETWDLLGLDSFNIGWWNADGDSVHRSFSVPGMEVWIGKPRINFRGHPGALLTAELYDGADGPLIGLAGGFLSDATLSAKFTTAYGDTIQTLPGDHIVGSMAADADFLLPNVTASTNVSTDKVTVNCGLAGVRELIVHTWDPVDHIPDVQRNDLTDSAGAFVANFAASPAANIKAGHKVVVSCRLDSGDWVSRQFTVS